jgi:predicted nucleotidyltransferase
MRTTKLAGKEIMATLKDQRPALKKFKVRRIGLFGSYVRGAQGKSSDIDFLVEFEEPSFDNFMELVFYLEALFGHEVDLITNGSLSPYLEPYVVKEVVWYEV